MATLAKNTLYLTFASVAQKGIAFVYFALIARYFSVESTGAYFLALAIVTVIMVLDDLGVTPVLIREVAKKPQDAATWLKSVIGIKLVTMPITIVLAFIVPQLLGYDDGVATLVRIAVIVMLADTLSLSFYGVMRGLQNLKYESIGIFIGQLATAGTGLALIASEQATLPLLVCALALGSTWNLCFSAYVVVKHLGWDVFVPTWKLGWKPLQMAFMFFLAAVFVKVYSYIDSIILSKVIGETAVGFYSVAYKLTYAFQFLPLAFIGALYPMMSAFSHDRERLTKILLDSFWYMALLVAPIVFGIWSLAPEIMSAFYGEKYIDSILPLQVLIFVLIPIFFDFPLGSLLNATNRQMTKTMIGGATMVLNIVANLILIDRFGIVGASISAVISFTFMLIVDWLFIHRTVTTGTLTFIKQVLPIFGSAAIMAAVVMFVKPYVPFVFAVPVGAIIYISGLLFLGSINKSHIGTMRTLVQRKTGYVESPPTND